MDNSKVAILSTRKFPRSVVNLLIRQLRKGLRLAYEPPTPAWKAKQKGYTLGIWFDVTLLVLLIVFALLRAW